MAYTNFCCRSGGSNLNAGTRTGNTTEPGTTAAFTYAAGNSDGTSLFTAPAGSNPFTDGVAVGDWGSVYLNAATVTVFIGRVTAVTATTITFSTTAKTGTFPALGTGTVTCKIGGAWAGPNGASGFPFSFLTNAATNTSANPVRINVKSDAIYSVTTGITFSSAKVIIEGYTTSYGDEGLATITSGSAIIIFTFSAAGLVRCLKFISSATTGSSANISIGTAGAILEKCVVYGAMGNGITITAAAMVIGCEVLGCNKANGSGAGAISAGGTGTVIKNCIIYNNVGTNNCGIQVSAPTFISRCILVNNGLNGIRFGAFTTAFIEQCDIYNNKSHGMNFTSTGLAIIRNSQIIKNGGWGINGVSTANLIKTINCAYGGGTMANTSGKSTGGAMNEVSPIDHVSNFSPYIDAAAGNFNSFPNITWGTAANDFLQTSGGYTGTSGFFDIGASQHLPNKIMDD